MKTDMDYAIVGSRIRSEREKFGITREKFSELVNLSSFYIGQIERGERRMSLDTLIKVSECLHVSIDYLIFGVEGSSSSSKNLYSLIDKCSEKESMVIEEVIKIILPHIKVLQDKT